jgi:thioredoxin 1
MYYENFFDQMIPIGCSMIPFNSKKHLYPRRKMALSLNERTFRQDVLESSIPVLVDFSAPWCGLCRIIQPLLREFQADWNGQVKLVRVNADENLKLATTYRIKSLPTLLLIEQGQVIQRLDHFQGRDEVRMALKTLMVNSFPKSA